uniref:Integrase n=1 Tax=Peronospora matthiolae TaxID=2874970 RepID=A0AAV1V297_9STRA
MILSRLWHYTQHVSISTTTVRRWQSMLNWFVLSRKHDRESSHVQLLPSAFLYQRCCDGGLGFPDLAAHLKRQRLQLLLQLFRGLETPSVRD